jgi:hypothetical protein
VKTELHYNPGLCGWCQDPPAKAHSPTPSQVEKFAFQVDQANKNMNLVVYHPVVRCVAKKDRCVAKVAHCVEEVAHCDEEVDHCVEEVAHCVADL